MAHQVPSVVLDLRIDRDLVLTDLRHDVGSALTGLGEDHLYDVLIVVTELVSNVLDHTTGHGRVRVLRRRTPCEVTVEVDDTSSEHPVYGRSRLGEHRGRGVVMVEGTSSAWGITLLPDDGKTVFAVVPCP
ncbi:ATP-binding protein [Lentzea sp. NBRC 102530]|uniref:ATP-binding protein n=1 Tax=Lentzea sp. NBRC 102530 TaxID=3032201 RepID=UPI0024A38E09|nr:ATP-binding protein [Lentzea sp. NBRC 102530]GLY47803.1 hypothetical protein Lesp01_14590 [Lentzea sp. NBRC 102530]